MVTNIRNRNETEARLISAMGELLAQQGFAKIGVNAVARQAKVDKVLIYRYFDGLDGLIDAYAASHDFWPSVDDILGAGEQREQLLSQPFEQILSQVFERYCEEIRSRPLTLEIMAWETIERNSLTIALENTRERVGMETMQALSHIDAPDLDWPAITALFSAAIHYLAVRGRKINVYNGVQLNDESGWQRIVAAMQLLITNTK